MSNKLCVKQINKENTPLWCCCSNWQCPKYLEVPDAKLIYLKNAETIVFDSLDRPCVWFSSAERKVNQISYQENQRTAGQRFLPFSTSLCDLILCLHTSEVLCFVSSMRVRQNTFGQTSAWNSIYTVNGLAFKQHLSNRFDFSKLFKMSPSPIHTLIHARLEVEYHPYVGS